MTTPTHDHLDYAEAAESAQRGEAWPQAAALWRRAADALRATAAHTDATFDLHAKYQAAAEECDRKERVNHLLEGIARANRGFRRSANASPTASTSTSWASGRSRRPWRRRTRPAATTRSNPCFPFPEGELR